MELVRKPPQVYCVLDYETYSEADLKKVGAYEYSMHESTEIMVVAWRIGTKRELRTARTHWWAPGVDELEGGGSPAGLMAALLDPDIILVAHNALFEQVITRNVLGRRYFYKERWEPIRQLHPSRWLCTASLAAALALPRNLEGAAQALKLPVQKDMEGRRLMLKMSKPRKPTLKDASTRHDKGADRWRLTQYCVADIAAEVELFLTAKPLSAFERRVWILDQTINLRGFLVDRAFVATALEMIAVEVEAINARTTALTGGALRSATQVGGVLSYIKGLGAFLPNLQKATVESALAEGLVEGEAREILEMRQTVSKTSTAKYEAFDLRSRSDGRVRDILVYHTASTGRWGGAGVQPQNFPRGTLKCDTIQAAEIIAEGDLELVRLIYGDVMSTLSSCLRAAIIAPPGKVFDVADYASIEVRVLFWLAGDLEGVRAFHEGRDLYKELAADIFHRPVALIAKDGPERFLGKAATLGCGYQMGAKRFAESCAEQGQPVETALAERAVKAYRNRHREVVDLWRSIEYAAVAAVETPGKLFPVSDAHDKIRITWQMREDFLWCKLPSGRELAYAFPTVRPEATSWGEVRPKLYHWGVDPLTKKWVNGSTYGGKLTENVVQAISRDLMAAAMLRIESTGKWEIVLSVHDELIAERSRFIDATNDEFCMLMEELPAWADGCPVKAEGWAGERYKK